MSEDRMIPLTLEVVTDLEQPASLHEGPDGCTWALQLGASTHQTAAAAAKTMSDEVLFCLLVSFGLGHIPCDQARQDPVAALGPLAHERVTWDLIPPQCRPKRA